MPAGAGGREEVAGASERGGRHGANEPLVADDAHRGQRDDRLVHRPQLPAGDDLGNGRSGLAAGRGGGLGRVEQEDIRAAGSLGSVQGRIGLGVELLTRGCQLRQGGDTGREGDAGFPLVAQRRLQGGRQQATSDDPGALGVGVRQEDRELVATDPEGTIDPAQARDGEAAEVGQGPVAGGVALLVVDRLELVDVQQDERDRDAVAVGLGDLTVELLLERTVVAETGERIGEGIGQRRLVTVMELGTLLDQGPDHREMEHRPCDAHGNEDRDHGPRRHAIDDLRGECVRDDGHQDAGDQGEPKPAGQPLMHARLGSGRGRVERRPVGHRRLQRPPWSVKTGIAQSGAHAH